MMSAWSTFNERQPLHIAAFGMTGVELTAMMNKKIEAFENKLRRGGLSGRMKVIISDFSQYDSFQSNDKHNVVRGSLENFP